MSGTDAVPGSRWASSSEDDKPGWPCDRPSLLWRLDWLGRLAGCSQAAGGFVGVTQIAEMTVELALPLMFFLLAAADEKSVSANNLIVSSR